MLVVDDEEYYRECAAAPFRKRGDVVHTTCDGLEALAYCLREAPDIILSDVQMPRMDGWQFLRLIRARPALARVPVVFLTSLNGDAERLLGYQLGVDGYIPKPYAAEELLVRVHQILRRSAASAGARRLPSTLRGEIEHVGPSSLLSFFELEQKSGVLLLVGEAVVRLFISHGQLLRAELEGTPTPLSPREILTRALDFASGQFEFLAQPVTGLNQFPNSTITSLLLEHARSTDERSQHDQHE